jgi:hypothetical protein
MLAYNPLAMSDRFSDQYADLLEGQYDGVDRIVLNAYFPPGQKAGGFRTWWRLLNGGDETLDDTHLMRRPAVSVAGFVLSLKPAAFPWCSARREPESTNWRGSTSPQHPKVRGVFL